MSVDYPHSPYKFEQRFRTDFGTKFAKSVDDLIAISNMSAMIPLTFKSSAEMLRAQSIIVTDQASHDFFSFTKALPEMKIREILLAYYLLALHAYTDTYCMEMARSMIERGPIKLKWTIAQKIVRNQSPENRIAVIFAKGSEMKKKLIENIKGNSDAENGKYSLPILTELRNDIAHNKPIPDLDKLNEVFSDISLHSSVSAEQIWKDELSKIHFKQRSRKTIKRV